MESHYEDPKWCTYIICIDIACYIIYYSQYVRACVFSLDSGAGGWQWLGALSCSHSYAVIDINELDSGSYRVKKYLSNDPK